MKPTYFYQIFWHKGSDTFLGKYLNWYVSNSLAVFSKQDVIEVLKNFFADEVDYILTMDNFKVVNFGGTTSITNLSTHERELIA
ncbi:hypothetical protein [Thiomicrospira sp.]|uniref:hypothetical protein n=1 Tax=Thiomicrospira sp. TaxID=935 RepID=UPI002F956C5B